ncbi:hypothetical protein I6F14_05240 [Bradyrhizobium sp. IC3069]|uniref:DUF6602 domain-containing protein n=1 Tax=unclassified Bradyrhizobium TaxID=2631580 RepID=UPI001CD4031A|nr:MULTISPECIES: DUF6602 domain-containing protein [unclassified Bradyrhizobium]MCA1359189.1 hypothetical protein [Bradyrhizobium sp. IC4059]MCA1517438.1 hypothetical protein [Bradyrhizobium sp. IC3069]
MLTSLATILQKLQQVEAAKLAQENITHAPTIGAMYEGLTRDLLDRAIPAALDVRVVSGFVEGHDGQLGPQTDAMLVTGEGRPVPYTGDFVWPIQNILAVFEVKKNLYGADLDDAFQKLRTINDMFDAYVQSEHPSFDINPAFNAFARLTGRYPRSRAEIAQLPEEWQFFFSLLVTEQVGPIRVILGYEGYVDEAGLRRGFADYLEQNNAVRGFGLGSYPSLIICRNNSLLKMNGQPYISPLADGRWVAVVSNHENPIRILLELIWTRLSNQFQQYIPMDDTLQLERLAPFFLARIVQAGQATAWQLQHHELDKKELASIESTQWAPREVDENEWVIMQQVANKGELDIRDRYFREWAQEENFDPDDAIAKLVADRLLAWVDKHHVRVMTQGDLITAFMPSGQTIVTSDDELAALWMMEQLEARKKSKE